MKVKQHGLAHIGLLLVLVTLGFVGFVGWRVWKARVNQSSNGSPLMDSHWQPIFTKAFEEVDCPAPRDPQSLPAGYYKGPMFDTHIHHQSLPDSVPGQPLTGKNLGSTYSMDQWICMLDTEGTYKAFGFFPVWEPIVEHSVEVVNRTMKKYPGRFVPFIMPPDDDGSLDGYPTVDSKTLEDFLSVRPGLFEGYGEIGLYARGDDGQGSRSGAAALPPDSARLTKIYPIVRKHDLLIYFHPGFNQKDALMRAASANRDLTFVFHGGHLYKIPKDQVGISHDEKIMADIEEILYKNPNVYYGVDELYGGDWLLQPGKTKEEFIANFKDYKELLRKDLSHFKGFIERHPNQVIWGTDRGVSNEWDMDPEVAITLNNYVRAFIGKLDPAVQEKFAYQNAERIISSQ